MERVWATVKANKGAPGPDGITLDEFPESFRRHWPEVRQQLLEGTYRPGPARRKSIPLYLLKHWPTAAYAISPLFNHYWPNVIDRLIQQAVLQVLRARKGEAFR